MPSPAARLRIYPALFRLFARGRATCEAPNSIETSALVTSGASKASREPELVVEATWPASRKGRRLRAPRRNSCAIVVRDAADAL